MRRTHVGGWRFGKGCRMRVWLRGEKRESGGRRKVKQVVTRARKKRRRVVRVRWCILLVQEMLTEKEETLVLALVLFAVDQEKIYWDFKQVYSDQ